MKKFFIVLSLCFLPTVFAYQAVARILAPAVHSAIWNSGKSRNKIHNLGVTMLATLEKYWSYLSLLLILLLLAAPFVWPGAAALLNVIAIILGVVAVILFNIDRHVKAYKEGQLDRAGLLRNIAIDLPGLLLTIAVAVFAGRAAGQFVGQAAGRAAEQAWQGWGVAAGILCGLLAGLLVGLIVGFVVRTVWGKLFRTVRNA